MAVIRTEDGFITQINVFTVAPEKQQDLIGLLTEAARFASTLPGWVSASIHRRLDGTKVGNYAQSHDLESAQAIISSLKDAGWFERNKALAESHPGLYEVVFTKSA